ncbi:hypothetical protein AYK24_07265 [Thermoplasmatales archaeon SG8-52-4]|nr:MAG: hypothetical protein AYK24_07265 [Thermoplasmatales archaeon SG8-52-4]
MLVKEKNQLIETKTSDKSKRSNQLTLILLKESVKNFNCNRDKQTTQHQMLKVPKTISYLCNRKNGKINLSQERPNSEAAFILEPVYTRNRNSLLIVCMEKKSVWINGQLAPRVALAHENDEIFFQDYKCIFHLSLNCNDRISLCPEDKVGYRCPICRKVFNKKSIIYMCHCGLAVHAEKLHTDNEEPSCANLISECLDCGRVVKIN